MCLQEIVNFLVFKIFRVKSFSFVSFQFVCFYAVRSLEMYSACQILSIQKYILNVGMKYVSFSLIAC